LNVELVGQRRRLPDERANSADDLPGSFAVPDDPIECLPDLVQIGRLGAKPTPRRIGVGERRSDRLADFVGDRSRQLTRRRHAVGVGEFQLSVTQAGLASAQFLFGAPQILDIRALCVPFDDPTPFVAQRDEAQ